MRWYVLYLKPRLEKRTAELCRMNTVPHYLPLRTKTTIHQRRKVTTQIPLFPGYLFVALTPETRLTLQKTNYVLRFLEPARPWRMLRQLVQIRRALSVDPSLRPTKLLRLGHRVRVLSGPFQGIEGVVTRLASTMRVILTVEMIGQGIAVEVQRDQVEPLGTN